MITVNQEPETDVNMAPGHGRRRQHDVRAWPETTWQTGMTQPEGLKAQNGLGLKLKKNKKQNKQTQTSNSNQRNFAPQPIHLHFSRKQNITER